MTPPRAPSPRGLVLFPDPTPIPAERVAHLPGVVFARPSGGAAWSANVTLDGVTATLEPVATFERFPEVLLRHDPRLSEQDRATVRAGRSAVSVALTPPEDGDPFVVRKKLVRLLGRVLGEHGAAALDATAQRVWPREQLDDELAHDAPLHIDQMMTLHAVTQEGDDACTWLHSHGLEELGAFDFDILRPHPTHVRDDSGVVRAAALASVEGRLRPGGDPVRLTNVDLAVDAVDAARFMESGAATDVGLRSTEDHSGMRMVLCDPKSGWGWSKRRPARQFQVELPDGTLVFLSTNASRMAARRARGTYDRLRAIAEEFAGLDLPVLAKLSYEVDGGGPDDREHLWFQIHAFLEDAIEATLTNAPRRIQRLRQGERGRHSIERLSDWVMLTPVGSVAPHSLFKVRELRRERKNVEKRLAERRRST
jgi:hypothetical protein